MTGDAAAAEEPPPPAAAVADDATPSRLQVLGVELVDAEIAIKHASVNASNVETAVTLLKISLLEERIDPSVLATRTGLLVWLNTLVARTIASSGIDVANAAVGTVAKGATAATDKAFGAVDLVAGALGKVDGGLASGVPAGATAAGARSSAA